MTTAGCVTHVDDNNNNPGRVTHDDDNDDDPLPCHPRRRPRRIVY